MKKIFICLFLVMIFLTGCSKMDRVIVYDMEFFSGLRETVDDRYESFRYNDIEYKIPNELYLIRIFRNNDLYNIQKSLDDKVVEFEDLYNLKYFNNKVSHNNDKVSHNNIIYIHYKELDFLTFKDSNNVKFYEDGKYNYYINKNLNINIELNNLFYSLEEALNKNIINIDDIFKLKSFDRLCDANLYSDLKLD